MLIFQSTYIITLGAS